jgi:hypothetical protein
MMKRLLQAMSDRRQRREQAQLKAMRIERDQGRRREKELVDQLLAEKDDNNRLREALQKLLQARWRDAVIGRVCTEKESASAFGR